MTELDVRHRLVRFLDHRVFDPVLQARPDDYPPGQREALREVQRVLHEQRIRFHGYSSADQVYRAFHEELNSDAARTRQRTLRELGLPASSDVRIDFEQMAQDLELVR